MFANATIAKHSVIVSVILSLAGAAWSADLYVAQKDPKADDKNPGTEAMPFKTIQPATDAARVGDTVYVKAGVYSDRVHSAGTGGRDIRST